ncbi:MAG: AarF/ABC1/UbiB kinase family protein, partial [candidate division Zixibacteria bacterium]|nr:AarF/ABC1/UbiB kinase family protein [candidate division Zixibacteria bacterium]NIW44148.1 AarF/ABC1/UbiB kinase family protein [Gammaproteobacteria bacterium]NIR63220.1 AarF/ABC1/UbiB kinase family protein [candidate division Zixibacteria bacterium]NIS45207.1 AarF/ABC1/UbiB kinase family protein [candidate division Zixibacteria bacterium]NIT53376.1 AarF/ABC1/UbiB kinase family protein [candidate division Zixibacteria bacterium]
QDEVPPISFDELRKVAEEDFNASITEKYSQFATNPLAAASLGQAHRARLHAADAQETGFTHVVVKVLRPNIERIVDTDLSAFDTVGNWLKRYPPISRRADVKALIKEFSDVLYEELDYLSEGTNAEIFAENFKDEPG